MTDEEKTAIAAADAAHYNYEQILLVKANISGNFLVLARLLYENHRDSLYKLLNCDSFNEFLGMPEIGFKKSKAYDLIAIWELFKTRMNVDDRTLLDIDRTKLKKLLPIASAVEGNPEEWLSKARSLSVSDLAIEIAGVSGKEVSISPPSSLTPAPLASSCVNGCQGEVDKHHFPVGRVSSADEAGDWTIPLCRKCHTEYHQEPKEWTWTYRKNWMRYLVNRGK